LDLTHSAPLKPLLVVVFNGFDTKDLLRLSIEVDLAMEVVHESAILQEFIFFCNFNHFVLLPALTGMRLEQHPEIGP